MASRKTLNSVLIHSASGHEGSGPGLVLQIDMSFTPGPELCGEWRRNQIWSAQSQKLVCGKSFWTSQDHKWNLIEVFPNLTTIQQLSVMLPIMSMKLKEIVLNYKKYKTSLVLSQLVIRVNIWWDESGPSSVWSSCPKPRIYIKPRWNRQTQIEGHSTKYP